MNKELWHSIADHCFGRDAPALMVTIRIDVGEHPQPATFWDETGSGRITIQMPTAQGENPFSIAHELAHAFHCHYMPGPSERASRAQTEAVALVGEYMVGKLGFATTAEVLDRGHLWGQTVAADEELARAWHMAQVARTAYGHGTLTFRDITAMILEGRLGY